MTLSPQVLELRNALGQFTTGVTVITTLDDQGKKVGMTANSFSSVSLDPPMVLWAIGKDSTLFKEFSEQASHFNINVLSAAQQDLSNHFANPSQAIFDESLWDEGQQGLPVLKNAGAVFQCAIEHRYPGGDHIIMVGRVLEFSHTEQSPLVFHSGNYRALKD